MMKLKLAMDRKVQKIEEMKLWRWEVIACKG